MPAVSTTGLSSVLDTIVSRVPHPTIANHSMLVRGDGCIMSPQPVPGLPVQWRDPKNPPTPDWQPGTYEACLPNEPVVAFAPLGAGGQAVLFSYLETVPNA